MSAAVGGPLAGEKVNFFLAAEFTDQGDRNPRSVGALRMTDDAIAHLNQFPTVMSALDASGNQVWLEVPATLSNGAKLPVDDNGVIVVNGGVITASDGTTISVPDGVVASSITPDLREGAAILASCDPANPTDCGEGLWNTAGARVASIDKEKRRNANNSLSFNGNLQFSLMDNIRFRVGGRYVGYEQEDNWDRVQLFAPDNYFTTTQGSAQFFATWTHYLSNSTFYQLQFDYSSFSSESYNQDIGSGVENMLLYGDIEGVQNGALQAYKNLSYTTETRTDADGNSFTVEVPTYANRYTDGRTPTSETVARLVAPTGGMGSYNNYSQTERDQIRFTASATTQIGLHQVEFGGEFEQQTRRFHSVAPDFLSRYFADGNPEALETGAAGVSEYSQLTFNQIESYIGSYYGFNFLGTEEVDNEDLTGYITDCGATTPGGADGSCYDVAPHKPIYYGGYVQDKIEFRDIVLNLGLRVDVFDNNTRQLYDRYTWLPLERGGGPAGVPADAAPYYNGNDVLGYRDRDGQFYDANGQEVQSGVILLTGARPRQTASTVTADIFEDYEPQVTVMPRIGVSFPVTDQALFFARYGKVAQRPSANSFTPLSGLDRPSSGRVNNNGLLPEETTEYELGFRQRLGARSALTISGFFRQIENLIQLRAVREAFPTAYTEYSNIDFGTVKGVEFDYDLRRTGNVSLNANYTLSFAQGTGSSSTTTTNAVWIDETPPNFISPLAFDQRHSLNLSIDYRLGAGEGPSIFGSKLLENFGVNVLATSASGQPYTPSAQAFSQIESKAPRPVGGINTGRMPWSSRIDLRVDRKFAVGARSTVSAFLWVQNVLDSERTQGVWTFTGLPDDDGFLATTGGEQFLDGQLGAAESLYRHRNRQTGNYGIPRITRIGVRVDF
jgi:outer membrane receptor protein involved in Fe transport